MAEVDPPMELVVTLMGLETTQPLTGLSLGTLALLKTRAGVDLAMPSQPIQPLREPSPLRQASHISDSPSNRSWTAVTGT